MASLEVFVQSETGAPHEHVGSVRAADNELAIQNARDVYSRRGKVQSIWVVEANFISATAPAEKGFMFDTANDKAYRHPQFYKVPRGVKGL